MRSIRRFAPGLLAVLVLGCGVAPTSDGGTPATAGRAAATVAGDAEAGPSAQPASTPTASQRSTSSSERASRPDAGPPDDLPARIVIEELGIDLPIVSGDLEVDGNPPDYPLCDVAQYLTTYRYPARPGTTTWIYAHARRGMFLPLLEASRRADGAELLGSEVELSSTGSWHYRYRITGVHPHATDRGIAAGVPEDEGRLVLQTSEGPRGTVPKLQISAVLVDVRPTDPAVAAPSAQPRECYD